MVGKMCEALVAEHNQPAPAKNGSVSELSGITTQQLSREERGRDKAVHF